MSILFFFLLLPILPVIHLFILIKLHILLLPNFLLPTFQVDSTQPNLTSFLQSFSHSFFNLVSLCLFCKSIKAIEEGKEGQMARGNNSCLCLVTIIGFRGSTKSVILENEEVEICCESRCADERKSQGTIGIED